MKKKVRFSVQNPRSFNFNVPGFYLCTGNCYANGKNLSLLFKQNDKVFHREKLIKGKNKLSFNINIPVVGNIIYSPSEGDLGINGVSFKKLVDIKYSNKVNDSNKKCLFITGTFCIRAYKVFITLRNLGYEIYVLCDKFATGVPNDSFSDVVYGLTKENIVITVDLFKPNVIHVHNFPDWPTIFLKEIKIDIPVIHDVHDYIIENASGNLPPEDVISAISVADHIITVSDNLKNILKTHTEKNITVIPNASITEKSGLIKKFSEEDGKLHLVYIGSFYSIRFIPKAFEVFHRLLSMNENTIIHIHANYFRDVLVENINDIRIILEKVLTEKNISTTLSKYDCGIEIPNKQTEFALPNKLFDYVASGLPFICNMNSDIKSTFGDWAIDHKDWDNVLPNPVDRPKILMKDYSSVLEEVYNSLIDREIKVKILSDILTFKKLKITYLGWDNTAGIPQTLVEEFRRFGSDAIFICGKNSYINYHYDMLFKDINFDIKKRIESSDVVFVNSCNNRDKYSLPGSGSTQSIDIPNSTRVIRIGHGSYERKHNVKDLWDLSVVTTPDLIHLVPKAVWIPGPIDTTLDKYSFLESFSNKLMVSHSPTNRGIKGTDSFISAINRLKREGYDIEPLIIENKTHDVALEMRKCALIHFDQFPLGAYGVSAVEGLLLGQLVLVGISDLCRKHYESRGGRLPFFNVNSEIDIYNAIVSIIKMKNNEINRYRIYGRVWATVVHNSRRIACEYLDKIREWL